MARGDHIWVIRPLKYTHHGIDCGDGMVVHFTGEPGKKSDAAVAGTPLAEFALDSVVHQREYSNRKDQPDVVIGRAESKVGTTEYNLVTNNCEHFATWCCTGRVASQQVRMTTSLNSSGAAVVTSAGTTAGVIGAVGSVAGLSGSGIMSGLASAGGVIGGGAAAGPLAIGVAPALVSVTAVQLALRQDDSLRTRRIMHGEMAALHPRPARAQLALAVLLRSLAQGWVAQAPLEFLQGWPPSEPRLAAGWSQAQCSSPRHLQWSQA